MDSDPHLFSSPEGTLPSGVSLLARDGAVLSLAPGMAAILGRPGPERVRLRDFVDARDRGHVDAALARLRVGGERRIGIAVRPEAPAAADAAVPLVLEALHLGGEAVVVLLHAELAPQQPAAPLEGRRRTDRRNAACGADACPADLQNAHGRLNALADTFPGALFEVNISPAGLFRFRYTSARFAEIMGVASARFERDGMAVTEVIAPEELARARKIARAAVSSAGPFRMDLRIAHPTAGRRWLMVTATPIVEDDGSVTWFGTLLDITETKAVEQRAVGAAQALAQAHARLRYLTDGATVGLFEIRLRLDGRWTFPYVSARFQDLTGCSGAGVVPLSEQLAARIDPRDIPRLKGAILHSHRDLAGIQVRFRLYHPARGLRWLEASAGAPTQEAGAHTWVAALHDVTTAVMRERELRAAHRLAEDMRIRNEAQALHDGLTGLPNPALFRRHDRRAPRRGGRGRSGRLHAGAARS
jgi:PAS domain S-box-containing protein